eukprot:3718252-Rhodomonas_salina.1
MHHINAASGTVRQCGKHSRITSRRRPKGKEKEGVEGDSTNLKGQRLRGRLGGVAPHDVLDVALGAAVVRGLAAHHAR